MSFKLAIWGLCHYRRVVRFPTTGSPSGIRPCTICAASSWQDGTDVQIARDIRAQLTSSILVVAGNHDEFSAIRNATETKSSVPIPLDPHGLFECVPDGFTLEIGKEVIGFCEGGDPEALQHNHPKSIDISFHTREDLELVPMQITSLKGLKPCSNI